jgi:eukaryotic-like serine/threonine-protein kinase
MMSEVPADAGIRFGQYVLVRRIARGGMAEVFLAQQRGLEGFDRRVAVKRILPHLADSPDFVKMFLGEAKLAAQLSHPNVVHIYEFGKVEHDYFIAMEFVDGVHMGQLFKHGQDKDKIPATLIARIGADAANALHYAHELRAGNGKLLGLVHRDVSPANIMVSFDGVVKLCDFGIAKAAAAGDQLTNPGQVKGKYAYMSPEQTIASGLDGRSDVFSLGVVMWELLAGKYIVPRGDAVAAMRAIRDGKLDPIEKAAPDIPPPLAKALTWALEPKREKRATAADFAQALEAFLKSAPELATSMQLGGWIRARFVREGTGQLQAIPLTGATPGAGTQMSPGTFAAPGTAASAPGTLAAPGTAGARSITQGPVTPAPV